MRAIRPHIVLFLLTLVFTGCNLGSDCLEAAGEEVVEELAVAPFTSIEVYEDIALTVAKGEEYKVVVSAGKNIIENAGVNVVEGRLTLSTDKPCDWLSGNKVTSVHVTTPELLEIRSYTQYAVRSDGVLEFDRLDLRSVMLGEDKGVATGEFFMEVDVNTLNIEANEFSNFEIRGRAGFLKLRLVDGTVRAFMPDLEVADADIYHRSAQDITIRPTASVRGKLLGTGNLVLLNTPPVVEVEELYKGRVIYE